MEFYGYDSHMNEYFVINSVDELLEFFNQQSIHFSVFPDKQARLKETWKDKCNWHKGG